MKSMSFSIKERMASAGRFKIRGIIYAVIGTAGLVVELVRFSTSRPFSLIVWAAIMGVGGYLLLFMPDQQK
jgi:hypothetical protein